MQRNVENKDGFAFWNVLRREIVGISKNKAIYSLSIFFPIILFTLLCLIYKDGVVKEIPIVICDRDHSSLSDAYCQLIESDGSMKIIKYVASYNEIEEAFKNGGIYAGIYIPDNFESDIKKSICTSVIIYNNSLNIITNNTILKSGKTFTKNFSGAILLKKLRSKGVPEDAAMNVINKITVDTQSLYNPNYNYLDYLIPGLLPSMLQMIIMVVAVTLFGSEFAHNTFEELLEVSHYKFGALIFGKSLPHIILHTITSIGILSILFPVFGISGEGSLLLSIAAYFIFVCASFFMGLAISALIHDQYMSTEIVLFLNTPAFIFSGFIFPSWAMPAAYSAFANILPITHFINAFIKLYFMDTDLQSASIELRNLILFSIFSLMIIIPAVFHMIRKSNRKISR